MIDGFHRTIDYMRISVTDRCNLRCRYCMPSEGIHCTSMSEILTYEEIEHLCHIFADLGIRKLKITGGEPFVRKGICELIARLKQIPGISQVTLTTNGTLISPFLPKLKEIGIDGINFSLDTLDADTFYQITGREGLKSVLLAIETAAAMEMPNIKINCVPLTGINENDLPRLADFARRNPFHVRFIEMMPIGLGKAFSPLAETTVYERLCQIYGTPEPVSRILGNGPAHYYHFPGFQGYVGFISAMTHRFCETCNRIRLTSDGQLKTCLFYENGIDLKKLLRSGYSDEEIGRRISAVLLHKPEHHDLDNHRPEKKNMSQIGG